MNVAPHTWTGHNPVDQSDLHLAEDPERWLGYFLVEERNKDCHMQFYYIWVTLCSYMECSKCQACRFSF